MSSYRPICDTWPVVRPSAKYYGAYPKGFLERARVLLGCGIEECVLHLCSGKVAEYPYAGGFGPSDVRVDIDPAVEPDLVVDITEPLPFPREWLERVQPVAVLADPPYTEEDARHYGPASEVYPLPSARDCLNLGLSILPVGGRVGILHYVAPRPSKGVKFVACVTVFVGFENRPRLYSVYEKR